MNYNSNPWSQDYSNNDEDEIDTESLRKDLLDEFNAAYFAGYPQAICNITAIENASEEELIDIAESNNINPVKYKKRYYR